MLLNAPSPDPTQKQTKLFISQPRRIAAKALVERLRSVEPELKDHIALRMGHGVKEYENKQTRAWFVTTGYLVRLLANHPERFEDISVLIIDEVHERSVDTGMFYKTSAAVCYIVSSSLTKLSASSRHSMPALSAVATKE